MVAYVAAAFAVYVITMTLLPQKGQDVPAIIANIARNLTNTRDVKFVYEFKVIGEPKIIVVAEVAKPAALERILDNVKPLGLFETETKLVITYEDFARELGVDEELIRSRGPLQSEGLIYLKYTADYYGNTTEEYRAARKRSVEVSLVSPSEANIEIYKNVAEREQHIFLNTNNTADTDKFQVFDSPLAQDLGSNIHIISYALQFLGQYIADVVDNSDY